MTKVDQVRETYDHLYETGGESGIYHQPYVESCYYPMFSEAMSHAVAMNSKSLLEVGCGNGAFAEMLHDRHQVEYLGFDFSEKAIELARLRNRSTKDFFVGDALDPSSYQSEYDTIICTEVLEHVPDDLAVINNWHSGRKFVCSVPSFDSKYHVRSFESKEAVSRRYGGVLRIEEVSTVIHPKIPGEIFRTCIGRYCRFLFSRVTGREVRKRWYVFSGTIK